jgi:hypothetical protein
MRCLSGLRFLIPGVESLARYSSQCHPDSPIRPPSYPPCSPVSMSPPMRRAMTVRTLILPHHPPIPIVSSTAISLLTPPFAATVEYPQLPLVPAIYRRKGNI